MNSQNEWSKVDGAFSAEKFFWTIVETLEGEVEMLGRINRYVPFAHKVMYN